MASSSSNALTETSNILDTVFKHIEEDMKRSEKLNLLIKSFQKADSEKTQLIQSLQNNPNLSDVEQEYLHLLRMQCVKDWNNTSKCTELLSGLSLQIEEKQEFVHKNCHLAAVNIAENNEQPIIAAETAEDFFFHGDIGQSDEDQYCKIGFLPDEVKCCRNFWGVLLGFTENNVLWDIHVEAWIRRSSLVHRNLVERETVRTMTRYAVVPISFHDDFMGRHRWDKNYDIAFGYKKPYIRWKNVDSVLIPVCSLNDHWFLIEYKLAQNELCFYDRDKSASPAIYMEQLRTFYQEHILWFYNNVRYISAKPLPKPPRGSEPNVYLKNVKQSPGCNGNSAVFMCMFIHYLVTGESSEVVTADVSPEQLAAFRKRMATVLYAKRKV